MAIRSLITELKLVKLLPEANNRILRPMRSYHRGPIGSGFDDSSRELNTMTGNELVRKILRLKYPAGCVTTVLQSWIDNGFRVSFHELRKFSVKLLKLKRYNHALQMMDWMESQSRYRMSTADYSIKMQLIIDGKGLNKAEEYFEKLSSTASQKAACFQLLHGYVKAREATKAESFMAKLNGLGLIVSPHHYNEIMKLYIATSDFGKVPLVIAEMRSNGIPLNVLSYNLWMNACWEISGVELVETVYKEMMRDSDVEIGWSTLSTLANVYVKAGKVERAGIVLKCAEKKLSSCDRLGYFFLITQHATLNNKEEVLRLWEACKAVDGRISCANYMSVMLCLVKMCDLVEAERVFREWESNRGKYDIRVSNVLLGAYARSGMMDKAEKLHLQTLERGGSPNYKTWEILMEGWLKTQDMDKAISAMKKAFSMLKHCQWRPSHDTVMTIAEYFEEQGNVEGANWYVKTAHDFGFASLPLYKSLLRMHRAARRPGLNILKMMKEDNFEMDEESSVLIRAISEVRSDNAQ